LIDARVRSRIEAVRGVTGLAGDAAEVPIPDILTMLELSRKTGILHVLVGHAAGRVVLADGRLKHAEIGNLVGQDAFFVLLQYHGGVYRFEPEATDPRTTIDLTVSQMLMASAVREDTARHERPPLLEQTITNTDAALRELGIAKRSIDLRSASTEAKPPPLSELTGRLGIAIADPYLLGDLVLATEIPAGPNQFRVELWTTVKEGIGALLGMASSPGYQVLHRALSGETNQLHLHFETPTASALITLVDIAHAPPPLPRHEIHGIVLVPPRGELVTLSPQIFAALTARLEQPNRPVIVGLGGTALHSSLERMADETGRGFHYLGLPPKFEDPRDVFGGVIRLWNASR